MTKKEAIGALIGMAFALFLCWAFGSDFERGQELGSAVLLAAGFAAFGASAARG
jgi:hypothetical protein